MDTVVLRKREGKKKDTLSLAIWNPEKKNWVYEPLKLYIYHDPQYSDQNKEAQKLAEIIRTRRQLEVYSGEHGEIPEHKKRGNFITFFENMTNGTGEFENAGPRDRNWKQALRVLKLYNPGPVSFKALNSSWELDFQRYLLKNYSHNMAWLIEVKFRAAIREAVRKRLLNRDFLFEVPSIEFKRNERIFLTVEEIQKMANTPCENEDLKRAFLFSCFSGLRFGDVRSLKWRNVEKDYLIFEQEKTSKVKRLPLNQNAKDILSQFKIIRPEGNVFTLLSPTRTNFLLRRWARKAGITKHISFHVGRHSYAFMLLRAGVDIYRVSKAMGHESIEMTMVYAHFMPEELRKDIDDKLPVFKVNGGGA
ncbi:MAG: tyrosine-type recombinase/integrase [Chrysiogenia bacterium]